MLGMPGRFTGAQLCSDCTRLGEYVKDKGKCFMSRMFALECTFFGKYDWGCHVFLYCRSGGRVSAMLHTRK